MGRGVQRRLLFSDAEDVGKEVEALVTVSTPATQHHGPELERMFRSRPIKIVRNPATLTADIENSQRKYTFTCVQHLKFTYFFSLK